MTKNLRFIVAASLGLALSGCIDNKYDLSDLDTTSEFQIKDLVLPLQMDPVVLSDIINVKEGDQIKEVTINGDTFYAVEESGNFESDGIKVNSFTAVSGNLSSKTAKFAASAGSRSGRKAATRYSYNLAERVNQEIDYEAPDVDGSVRQLTAITFLPMQFTISLGSDILTDDLTPELQNVNLELPTGLTVTDVTAPGYAFRASDYNPASGVLSLDKVKIQGGRSNIVITSSGIDLKGYDTPYIYNPATESGTFNLRSDFNIESAVLQFSADDSRLASIGSEIELNVTYDLTDLTATGILGSIEYRLEGTGLEIDPIELENLPDFLADPETNLVLANPQIYLNLDNPVGEYGLGYQSGLEIFAFRTEGQRELFPLGENNEIKVAGKNGSFNYLLAPDPMKVTDIPAEFDSDLTRMVYPNLGNILSGNGLPEKLDIRLIDPIIPEQRLSSYFKLGVEIPGMKGSYQFLAPLALDGASRIIYTKTLDGWWSDDLADLTITKLIIKTTAGSDIPLEAKLTIHPIDREGNYIKNLEIVPVTLPANAKDKAIEFEINGNITDLDGIVISATVLPDGSADVLAPDQYITLDDIRAKVSGSYIKEL